jgi:oligopeptidase B
MILAHILKEVPDLVVGIRADVCFVDVLPTSLDETQPSNLSDWKIWGNPIKNKKDFENLLYLSATLELKSANLPSIYAIGGLADTRVFFWEALKLGAAARAKNTSNNAIMVTVNMHAGHWAPSGWGEKLMGFAREQAYTIMTVDEAKEDL